MPIPTRYVLIVSMDVDPAYEDPAGDQFSGLLDFGKLWISNDSRFLVLNLEVADEILMQQFNQLSLSRTPQKDTDSTLDRSARPSKIAFIKRA